MVIKMKTFREYLKEMKLRWEVPAEPGSTPTPKGKVKLYHQTSERNLNSIRRSGIKLSHAKGYEGPKAIYASPPDSNNRGFYGPAHSTPTAEFHVDKDEYSAPFVRKDEVPAKDIIAHKEWHATVRYIDSNPELRKAVEAGEHDDLMKQGKNDKFAKAVRFVKKRAKSKLTESEDYRGMHTSPGPDSGAPLHDVSSNGVYPSDFYSHKGFSYYSDYGNDYDRENHNKIIRYRNQPDKKSLDTQSNSKKKFTKKL